jgi:hypothetical protein
MKKLTSIALIAVSVFLAFTFAFNPQTVTGSAKGNAPGPGTPLPDSIHKIIKKACMDCHADDGNFMAKGKVNFSSWDKYDSEKQFNKANTMCKELTKSAMPPKKWRAKNPGDVPTQAEVDMICRWAKSLQK